MDTILPVPVSPEPDDPPNKRFKSRTREGQVLQVFALLSSGECQTQAEACARVGISERTFQRWAEKSRSLETIDQKLSLQREAITDAVTDAWAKSVSILIEIVNGSRAVPYRDWVAAFQELKKLKNELAPDAQPGSDEDADRLLDGRATWLHGPRTVTVEMDDGTKVHIKSNQTRVIDVAPEQG